MKLKNYGLLEKIIIAIIIIACIIGIATISEAETVTTPGAVETVKDRGGKIMPGFGARTPSGFLPQYWQSPSNARQVALEDVRVNWQTESWTTTTTGEIVYCSDLGKTIRVDNYDNSVHYLYPGTNTLQGNLTDSLSGTALKDQIKTTVDWCKNYYEEQIGGHYYYTSINHVVHGDDSGTTRSSAESVKVNWEVQTEGHSKYPININAIGYLVRQSFNENVPYSYDSLAEGIIAAELDSEGLMLRMFDTYQGALEGNDQTSANENPDIRGDYIQTTVSATQGPTATVMETEEHASNGYKLEAGDIYTNNKLSYIFSASGDAYGNGEHGSKYNLNDIQTAYWWILNESGKLSPDATNEGTAKGKELYKEACDYADFLKETAGGYDATVEIDDSQAQVIANRDEKKYVVGPFSITYPQYQNISYIKSFTLGDSEDLVFDETHDGFKLIMNEADTVTGTNGMLKKYPKSGAKFFIEVDANKIKGQSIGVGAETSSGSGTAQIDPSTVQLHVRCEYISETTATKEAELTTKAHIYQYYGYCNDSGDYAMLRGFLNVYISYQVGHEDTESWPGRDDVDGDGDFEDVTYTASDYRNEEVHRRTVYIILQPYIKMGEEPVDTTPQNLSLMKETKRTYTVIDAKAKMGVVSYNPTKPTPSETGTVIDLTMCLGGRVWADSNDSKEGTGDQIFGSNDLPIPNMGVTLTCVETGETKSTKTLAGTAGSEPYQQIGSYLFEKLDPMKTYKVTFRYNGQYYQPVQWNSSSTWANTTTWYNNSNAMDNQGEREALNVLFETIGQNHGTYSGSNQSTTREDLQNSGAIDEFGLPLGGGSYSTYVQDCMINAYTIDAYPYPSVFVIDDKPVTREYMALVGGKEPQILYDAAYYINLGLDEREESDVALKKDVDHVVLEINGQRYNYTYNSLETKLESDGSWTIGVETSDAFKKNYGLSYTRKIAPEDFLYKVSEYGEPSIYGKDKDDELKIFITYKIMVRNQSLSIRTKINEIVDYYDEDLTYVDNRSYATIGRNGEKRSANVSESSSAKGSSSSIAGYKTLYVHGIEDTYLSSGDTAYIYLTFQVNKKEQDGEQWIILDQELAQLGLTNSVGKENIAEVNSYSTQYASGTTVPNIGDVGGKPAGIVDRDSSSGDVQQHAHKEMSSDDNGGLEDDEGKAPNIRIILKDDEETRVISGNVFEDSRTQTIDSTTTADGLLSKGEKYVNGVTVQLVELMENGTEYVWREFGDNKAKTGELGGQTTIGKGTGSGTVDSETPIINKFNLVQNYNFDSTTKAGAYAFKSFMPGKYIVRFIYGDTIKTATPASLGMGGLNEKSYNGQDYKSTTYQKGINQNLVVSTRNSNNWINTSTNLVYRWNMPSTWNLDNETLGKTITEVATQKADYSNNETVKVPNTTQEGWQTIGVNNQDGYLYDITASDALPNVSDAKDIESRRVAVNQYSDNDVTNYIAEVLASHKSDYTTMNDRTQLLNDLMINTSMTAETGMMVIEVEYDNTEKQGLTTGNDTNIAEDDHYQITNVNLGLEERPKSQLALNKVVTNVKLTLADGSTLFDAKGTTTNVLWRDHKNYIGNKASNNYDGKVINPDRFGSLENIRALNANKAGLIQLTMDEELMHGATIQITYALTVTNIGEVDYYNVYNDVVMPDRGFYYTGVKSNNAQVVTTRADKVLDYVANNLQFNGSLNGYWHTIEKDEISSQGLVNSKLNSQVDKYNTIIISEHVDNKTDGLSKTLLPQLVSDTESSTTVPLLLTQLITSENNTDDLTYRNIAEIVQTTNTVGRRMEYSVTGNQDPTVSPTEIDTDAAQTVRILPPFGDAGRPYVAIALVAGIAVIVVGGIIFIKKKVLKK